MLHQNFAHMQQQPFLHHCCCTKPFQMAKHPRHVVGNVVKANVCHVISLTLTECAQWYEANKSTKIVQGIMRPLMLSEMQTPTG